MTLQEIGIRAFNNAREKGFYEMIDSLLNNQNLSLEEREFIKYLWQANRLMLIVSELSEALEGIRRGVHDIAPKSGGLGEELADAQIRLADLAIDAMIPLEHAVELKMDYNETLPKKHGNKIA